GIGRLRRVGDPGGDRVALPRGGSGRAAAAPGTGQANVGGTASGDARRTAHSGADGGGGGLRQRDRRGPKRDRGPAPCRGRGGGGGGGGGVGGGPGRCGRAVSAGAVRSGSL